MRNNFFYVALLGMVITSNSMCVTFEYTSDADKFFPARESCFYTFITQTDAKFLVSPTDKDFTGIKKIPTTKFGNFKFDKGMSVQFVNEISGKVDRYVFNEFIDVYSSIVKQDSDSFVEPVYNVSVCMDGKARSVPQDVAGFAYVGNLRNFHDSLPQQLVLKELSEKDPLLKLLPKAKSKYKVANVFSSMLISTKGEGAFSTFIYVPGKGLEEIPFSRDCSVHIKSSV